MAKQPLHACEKTGEIAALQTQMESFTKLMTDNGHDGIPTVLHKISASMEAANRRRANSWKWIIPLATFLGALFVTLVDDHYTLKQAPQTYVTQKVMAQWLNEFQNMAKALEQMAASKTIEEMQKYREEFEKHSKTFDYMNTTRGGAQKETFTK